MSAVSLATFRDLLPSTRTGPRSSPRMAAEDSAELAPSPRLRLAVRAALKPKTGASGPAQARAHPACLTSGPGCMLRADCGARSLDPKSGMLHRRGPEALLRMLHRRAMPARLPGSHRAWRALGPTQAHARLHALARPQPAYSCACPPPRSRSECGPSAGRLGARDGGPRSMIDRAREAAHAACPFDPGAREAARAACPFDPGAREAAPLRMQHGSSARGAAHARRSRSPVVWGARAAPVQHAEWARSPGPQLACPCSRGTWATAARVRAGITSCPPAGGLCPWPYAGPDR